MKKLKTLISISLIMALFASCEKDNDSKPHLVFSENTIVFNNFKSHKLVVSIKPAKECGFEIVSYPEWVTVQPTSGYVYTQKSNVLITPNVDYNTSGIYSGKLIIKSKFGSDTIELKGYFGFQIPDSLIFSVFNNTKTFAIVNRGKTSINYNLTTSNDLISLDVKSGSLAADGQQRITVSAIRESMLTDTYNSMIFVTIDGKTDTIHVKIDNFKERKIKLNSDVVDAEYSKSKDILVYVSSSPAEVHIYKPSSGTTESIPLVYIPTCISLSSDGETAVVGNDGHITYVNLNNKTVIRTFNVSCKAYDIVLGNNKWAYVFPMGHQVETIRCINVDLTYDNEVINTGSDIFANTTAKLHPSGKYIYGAYSSPAASYELEKYDIQNGCAAYLYNNPYHENYIEGDLWFSEDGTKIFTKGKTVLKTSDMQSQDMLYIGKITLETINATINWLDYSSAKNNLYLISSGYSWEDPNTPYIYIYNASSLAYKSKFELEKYMVSDNNGEGAFYIAVPYFVFSNSAGNNLFVLTKALDSGLENEWAIQKYTVE